MQVKTENHQICIYISKKEAQWLTEEIETIDTPNNGLITLNVLKETITTGIYLE